MKDFKLIYCSIALACAPATGQGEETVRELAEVTVSAAFSPEEEARSSVTQKTIIDRQGIAATGGLTVGEVLGKLPGIDGGLPSSDGTLALRARGMVRDSVQVLVDGERPAGNGRYALLIISRMPAGELERVEIMKGATAEYGNGAPVTINLVTNRARREKALDIKVAAGSREGQPVGQFSLTRSGTSGPWSWSLPLSLSQTDSPVERQSDRQSLNAGLRNQWQTEQEQGKNRYAEQYLAPKLNWKEGKSSFSLWPTLFRAQGQRTTHLERTAFADPALGQSPYLALARRDNEETRYRINRLRLEGETTQSLGKISGRLSLMDGHKDNDNTRDSDGDRLTESFRRRDRESNASLRLDRGWEDHLSSLALEHIVLDRLDNQRYAGRYTDANDFRAREKQRVVWLQDEWNIAPTLVLTGGLRGESLDLRAEGRESTHGALSPSLAARWDFMPGWQWRSSLGSGLKVPKLEEISNAPLRSTNANTPLEPDIRGNPDLRPERSINWEMSVDRFWPEDKASLGLTAFLRTTEDFIERRPAFENGRWVERPYNEGTARHWGLEVDFKIKTDGLGLSGGALRSHLTLPHGRVNDTRLGLRRSPRELPRYLWTLGYDQPLPRWSSSLGISLQQTGATRTDIPGEQWAETKSRSLVDAYWVLRLDPKTQLRLSLQNLLGTDLRRTQRAYSAGQEWQLGGWQNQPRAVLLTYEGRF